MSAKSVRNRRRKEKARQARKEAEAVVVALGANWRAMRQQQDPRRVLPSAPLHRAWHDIWTEQSDEERPSAPPAS